MSLQATRLSGVYEDIASKRAASRLQRLVATLPRQSGAQRGYEMSVYIETEGGPIFLGPRRTMYDQI